MKKILFILALIPILFTSCTKDPYADFTADRRLVEIGEEIYFSNRSIDAHDYEWDFGDGYYSYNFNAIHSWADPGFYTVTLTAFGRDGKLDRAMMDIEVLEPPLADLEITVEEYDEPYYLVSDARVRLYSTLTDWENESHMVVQGYTNESGKVLFIDLPANKRYYVDVYGDFHDNYQLAGEDVGWIETDVLVPGVTNTFVAVVDYYPEGKKAGADTKSLKIQRKQSIDIRNPRKKEERNKPESGIQQVR